MVTLPDEVVLVGEHHQLRPIACSAAFVLPGLMLAVGPVAGAVLVVLLRAVRPGAEPDEG
jgi:hypothetical protein